MTDLLTIKGPRRSGTTWTLETYRRAYDEHPGVIVRDHWRHGTFEPTNPVKEIAVVKEPFGWAFSYHNYLNRVRQSNDLDPVDERTPEEVRAWVERWARKVGGYLRHTRRNPRLYAVVRYDDLLGCTDTFEAVANTLDLPTEGVTFEPPRGRVDPGGNEKAIPFESSYGLKRRYVLDLPTLFRQGVRRALRQNSHVAEELGYSTTVPDVVP